MNVFIFTRQFIIFIDNKYINKKIREIMKSKLVFCKDHNFLIYFKTVMIKLKTSSKIIIKKIDFSKSFESFNFDNDLLDIKNVQQSF